jgi:hypothetical protein
MIVGAATGKTKNRRSPENSYPHLAYSVEHRLFIRLERVETEISIFQKWQPS